MGSPYVWLRLRSSTGPTVQQVLSIKVKEMSSMNLATQKRLGVLPKTEDTLSYGGHTYGNTHRGFTGRKPSPLSPGFFGVHGLGAASGDGKLHYFGNGPGQADLPMNGFYGIGSADLEYQAANMLIDGGSTHVPTNPPGMYGVTDYVTGKNVAIAAVVALLYMKFR